MEKQEEKKISILTNEHWKYIIFDMSHVIQIFTDM